MRRTSIEITTKQWGMLSALSAKELGVAVKQLCELFFEGKEPEKPEVAFRLLRSHYENETKEVMDNIITMPEKKRFDFYKCLLEHGVPEQTARDWMEVRKKMKASNTETAMIGLLREALKAGISVEEAVTMAAERSWRGFKAEWYNNEIARQNGISERGRQDRRREGGISDWTGADARGTF